MGQDTTVDFAAMFRNHDGVRDTPVGAVVFREGDAGDCLYVILDGEVDVSIQGRHVRRLQTGEIFGEMALVEARPRSATVTTHTACRLLAIDERRFLFLVTQTPYFAVGLLKLLASRLRGRDVPLA